MQTKGKVKSFLVKVAVVMSMVFMKANICLATGIGTQEVQAATDNIKRVITSIAMPLGRSSYFCKYSYCSIKNDSKCQ